MIYIKCDKCEDEIAIGKDDKKTTWCKCGNVGVKGGGAHYKIEGQGVIGRSYRILNKKGEE